MAKAKALLTVLLVLTMSFLLIGCGMIGFREAEPEEQVINEAEKLPEWLLSAHRHLERDEDLLMPKDEEEEEKEEEEKKEIAEPESTEETAAPEPAQETVPSGEGTGGSGAAADVEKEVKEPVNEPKANEIMNVTNESWMDGTYTGEWKDGNPHGQGTYYHPNGGSLSGNWVNGEPTGRHTLSSNGMTRTVNFDNGDVGRTWWDVDGGGGSNGWF